MKKFFQSKTVKQTVYTVLGSIFLVLGVLGLFLPILQGFLFIAIGISILATHNSYFYRLKRSLYRRFPRIEAAAERIRGRFHRPRKQSAVRHGTKAVVYYISAHGYGHSVRSCDVIRALRESRPDLPVIIRSATNPELFQYRLAGLDCRVDPIELDVGLVQHDSLRADLDESLRRAQSLIRRRDDLVKDECAYLSSVNASRVVADIPAIPFAAAENLGLRALGVANFSWDWIYSEFAERDRRWQKVVDAFAADYSKADILLRLPFSGPMQAFPRQMDVGLLTRPGNPRREEIAHACGADPGKRWILICFWSLEWDATARERIGALDHYQFFTMPEIDIGQQNTFRLSQRDYPFNDIVASVDGVLSKPGYGIISDCIANDKPLVYAERSDFLEYAVLVDNIRKYLRHACISMEQLYAADFDHALQALWGQHRPAEHLAFGGAETIAETIIRD